MTKTNMSFRAVSTIKRLDEFKQSFHSETMISVNHISPNVPCSFLHFSIPCCFISVLINMRGVLSIETLRIYLDVVPKLVKVLFVS